jgi:ribosome-associated protein
MTVPANHSDKNVPADVRVVEISREPVELYKILKFEGMVASGGQAKVVVAAGQVLVNGKIETQKRKKIVAGDTIEFNKEKIGIKLASTVTTEVSPPKTKAKPVAKKQVTEGTSGSSVAIDVESQ